MKIRNLLCIVLFVFLVDVPPLAAREGSYVGISFTARSFMPKNFELLLKKHEKDLAKGALLKNPRGIVWNETLMKDKRQAVDIVEKQAIYMIRTIRTRKHFSEIVYHFGVMSHYLTDLGMPLRSSDDGAYASVGREFDRLVEAKLPRFRILFNGYDFVAVEKNSFAKLGLQLLDEKISFEKKLASEFVKKGEVVSYTVFDDRSIPFGIASISYSRIVNNVVDVWYSIWKAAGGDYHQKPYEQKK
jgi:hypothetical protein